MNWKKRQGDHCGPAQTSLPRYQSNSPESENYYFFFPLVRTHHQIAALPLSRRIPHLCMTKWDFSVSGTTTLTLFFVSIRSANSRTTTSIQPPTNQQWHSIELLFNLCQQQPHTIHSLCAALPFHSFPFSQQLCHHFNSIAIQIHSTHHYDGNLHNHQSIHPHPLIPHPSLSPLLWMGQIRSSILRQKKCSSLIHSSRMCQSHLFPPLLHFFH